MKLIKHYKLVFLAIIIFIIISFFFYYFKPTFATSNLYTAMATFFVGCFAVGIYIQQKIDQKRDAANVILAEIRYAEDLIGKFKESPISTNITYQLLPSNHWGKYNYLFINDLDQDEITQINNFYNQCFVLDNALNQISIVHELKNKSQAIHQTISLIAKESLGSGEIFKINKDNYLKLIALDTYVFQGDAIIESIAKTLQNIKSLTTSSVGTKLKEIASH